MKIGIEKSLKVYALRFDMIKLVFIKIIFFNYIFGLYCCLDEFLYSTQVMSQITPLEVDILFTLCHLLHQRAG